MAALEDNKRSINGPIVSCNRRLNFLFHELKNTAIFRLHRVSILTPQMSDWMSCEGVEDQIFDLANLAS
jgi:hypothetical protein